MAKYQQKYGSWRDTVNSTKKKIIEVKYIRKAVQVIVDRVWPGHWRDALLYSGVVMVPPLNFISTNWWIYDAVSVAHVLALTLAVYLIFGVVLSLTMRNSDTWEIAGILIMMFGSVGVLRDALNTVGVSFRATGRVSVQVIVHLGFIGLIILWNRFARSHPQYRALLRYAFVILLVMQIFHFMKTIYDNLSFGNGASNVDVEYVESDERPNILLLLLDSYGRADVLKSLYCYDNAHFLDSLRNMGFIVADSSRTNYAQTALSITSMFEMSSLPEISRKYGEDASRQEVLHKAYVNARAWKILKQLGYSLIVSDYLPGFPKYDADLYQTYGNSRELSIHHYLQQTSWFIIQRKLGEIVNVTDEGSRLWWTNVFKKSVTAIHHHFNRERPIFQFVHLGPPHPPFYLGRQIVTDTDQAMITSDGSVFHERNGTDVSYFRTAYANQVDSLNKVVLALVNRLLKRDSGMVIIVMSDHGPGARFDEYSIYKSSYYERMANLFCIYAPDEVKEVMPSAVTPVNLFPLLFNGLFKAKYNQRESRSWISTWSNHFDFVDVTDSVNLKSHLLRFPEDEMLIKKHR